MSKKKVVVFAVHPDDETLGAGGTLFSYVKRGDEVHWIIMTNMHRDAGFSAERISLRDAEIEKVSALYGFKSTRRLPFTTTKLDSYGISRIVQEVTHVLNDIQPDIVFIPFKNDIHSDHKAAYQALVGLTKSHRYPYIKSIFAMEVLSETNFGQLGSVDSFQPNYYVDVTETFSKKLNVVDVFGSEFGEHPFARSKKSLEALAILRGSEIGAYHAESFMMIKMIDYCVKA